MMRLAAVLAEIAQNEAGPASVAKSVASARDEVERAGARPSGERKERASNVIDHHGKAVAGGSPLDKS